MKEKGSFYLVTLQLHATLHTPSSDDYSKLHARMSDDQFSRKMFFDFKGYLLPAGTYWIMTEDPISQIKSKAKVIAASVWPECSVLVIKVSSLAGFLAQDISTAGESKVKEIPDTNVNN